MGFGYKLKSQVSKELCPYCFEYFTLKSTPFRCSNDKCIIEKDVVYEKHWGTKPLKRVIQPKESFLKKFKNSKGSFFEKFKDAKKDFFERFKNSRSCDKCHNTTYNRICTNCHEMLPSTTGAYKNHIYAVIGGPDSGKTHYIAVLINLLKQSGKKMGLLIQELDAETRKRYKIDFYEPLFEKHEVLKKTRTITPKPLIYGITIYENDKIKNYLTLVFFDTAGENLENADTMSSVNKYIYRSDGIIMLIDPLQISEVRNKLPNIAKPANSSDCSAILSRTTQLIEKGLSLNPTDKISIPLAVSFTKMDAVEDLLQGDYQLKYKSTHDERVNLDDIEAVNSEMQALLSEWGENSLLQLARVKYKDNKFFGLSALGTNPHATQKVQNVIPKRVEDPFLWLLYKSGILKPKG